MQVKTIQETLSTNSFEVNNTFIYPNPTNGTIHIQINTATSDDVNVQLFDIQGRRVFENSFESNSGVFNKAVNLGALAQGVYFLDVQQGNKKATKRIIISE